jgi:hypothetical protein
MKPANKPHAANPAKPLRHKFERQWRGVADADRYAS